jgi:hypothetical protein
MGNSLILYMSINTDSVELQYLNLSVSPFCFDLLELCNAQ